MRLVNGVGTPLCAQPPPPGHGLAVHYVPMRTPEGTGSSINSISVVEPEARGVK